MDTKLYKSNNNVIIDGVCGGIAEYFGFNPTLLRIFCVIFLGATFWIYIALIFLMTSRPK